MDDNILYTLDITELEALNTTQKRLALGALESGQVVYFPEYSFHTPLLSDKTRYLEILSETILDGKHKNISFDYKTQHLGGLQKHGNQAKLLDNLTSFMQDYANFAKQIVDTLCPQYHEQLHWGRTSYRPAEISGRISSKRKDDTRIHIDSFAATPVNGLRILRVFCNINPSGIPRVWELGEPFANVIQHFSSKLPNYNLKLAKFLHLIKATKTLRSAYDHYQLHLHDAMKLDDHYQKTVKKNRILFPAHSTWLAFTDQVSHAALSGQFLLEQTFYLPVSAMMEPELSPLKYWEREKRIVELLRRKLLRMT